MINESRTYHQGRASATAGKGSFSLIPKAERVEHYHRSIVLARIFSSPKGKWVLKGGTALVWRDPSARATRDIDFFSQGTQDIFQAIQDFTATLNNISTAPYDIGFEYEQLSSEVQSQGNRQSAKLRVHLVDEFGNRIRNPISIDLVAGCRITGDIEQQSAKPLEDVLQTSMPPVLLYPIVDHLADKVAATMQTYAQLGEQNPSTRVKDLVDIVHIALTETIDGRQLRKALESERLERGLPMYSEGLVCPGSWATLYQGRKIKGGKAPVMYAEALSIAKGLVDPAIRGDADGKIWSEGVWQ